ncbi:MAG: hypothetical protein ABIB43_04535 [archaeon]
MKIFVTGISGSDATGYLHETKKLADKHKKDFNIHSVGKMFLGYFNKINQLNYDHTKILNCAQVTKDMANGAVYEQILSKIKHEKNSIIDTHATFFWNKGFERATNWYYIKELNPDMFVTVIDYELRTKARLDKHPAWSKQKISLNEVLFWQNVEVMMTQSIAQNMKKPFFVIPRTHSETTLYHLMFTPNVKKAYVSFPMSNLKKPENIARVNRFIPLLQKYYVVFNPRSVELSKDFNDVQAWQTTKRDLDWFIDQVDDVVMLIPEPVFTQGGSSEVKEAHENCKNVYGIIPHYTGPFEEIQFDEIFKNEEEFIEFLEKKGFKKLKL